MLIFLQTIELPAAKMVRPTEQYNPQAMIQEIMKAATEDKREQPWKVYTDGEAIPTADAMAVDQGSAPEEKIKVGGLADVQQLFFAS